MKQITIDVYTYAELIALGDQDAINRATDWLRECATDHTWYGWVYDDLEREYESLTSEEQLIELAEANEYMFRIDGRRE